MKEIMLSLAIAVSAYLLGCFSTGLTVAGRDGVDIRSLGSKNTGASNVLRVMGLKKGLITFVGDFLKATIACWIGSLLLPGVTFGIPAFGTMLAGLFVVIGHNWPVFYGFKGGKGVACSAAVIFFVNPLLGIIAIAVCCAVIALTKYISLGSMTMLLVYAAEMCVRYSSEWFVWFFTLALLGMCVYRHRANIQRLLKGTENKIGQKAKNP